MGANRDFRRMAEQLPPLVKRGKDGSVLTNPEIMKGSQLLNDMPHLKDADPKIQPGKYYKVDKPLLVNHFFMLKSVYKAAGKTGVEDYIKKVLEENDKVLDTPKEQ